MQLDRTQDAVDEDGADWEKLGSFSLSENFGASIVIVGSAFDVLVTPEREREYVIEYFTEACYDYIWHNFPAIPGGVAFGGDEGECEVYGRRDADKALVEMIKTETS